MTIRPNAPYALTRADRIAIFAAASSIVVGVLLAIFLPPVAILRPVGGFKHWYLLLPIAVAAVSPLIIGIGRGALVLPMFAGSAAVACAVLALTTVIEMLNVKLDPVEPEPQTVEVLRKHLASRSLRNRLTLRMRPSNSVVELDAPRPVYEAAIVGQVLSVGMGKGYFGIPWIASFQMNEDLGATCSRALRSASAEPCVKAPCCAKAPATP